MKRFGCRARKARLAARSFRFAAVWLLWITPLTFGQLEDDPLPRRGYFGVGLEPGGSGPRVFAVTPGSTAAASGIVAGDIVQAIDGKPTRTPEDVIAAIGRHKGGDEIRIDLSRNSGPESLRFTLKSYPQEEMANATVHYASLGTPAGIRLRTILSIPATRDTRDNGPFPAVLLIQGGGCGSVDTPFATNIGQTGLVHAIGTQGFVTMRVEKSGVGDSAGPPCDSIGFQEELSGYQAVLGVLRRHSMIDPRRVYLVGISLGGVFAPLLMSDIKLAGITVYGTLDGPPPPYPGRSAKFFEEFAPIDVAGAWAKAGTRVQVLRGQFDELTTTAAHQAIAEIVNQSAAGSAEYRELAGLDHCWTRHASLEASRNNCGRGETTSDLSDVILGFLRRNR